MRYLKLLFSLPVLFFAGAAYGAAGMAVTYNVDGKSYEGYYVSPADKAPLVC
jgi:hypothetical protein